MRASTASVINPFASSAVMWRSFMTPTSSSHSASLNCRRGAILLSVESMSKAATGGAPVDDGVGQRGPAAKTGVLRDKRLRLDQLEIVPGDS